MKYPTIEEITNKTIFTNKYCRHLKKRLTSKTCNICHSNRPFLQGLQTKFKTHEQCINSNIIEYVKQ